MNKLFGSILLSVIVLTGTAFAVEFSAETILTHGGGAKTSGKVYYKADRFRMDMKSPEEMSMITRMDKKVIWNIMPAQKMYMEIPFDLKNQPLVEEKLQGEIDRKQVGTETVNGHPTKKYLAQIYQVSACK